MRNRQNGAVQQKENSLRFGTTNFIFLKCLEFYTMNCKAFQYLLPTLIVLDHFNLQKMENKKLKGAQMKSVFVYGSKKVLS